MSSLRTVKHPKLILGAVGAALAIPIVGIVISFVTMSATPQQDPGAQQANASTVVVAPTPEISEPLPTQPPLPDPLGPEPTPSISPTPSLVVVPPPTASAQPSVKKTPKATPTAPTSRATVAASPDVQAVQPARNAKKTTGVVGEWNPPSLAPGTVSLRAPQLTSGVKVVVTVACSPSVKCAINGNQLIMVEGARATVIFRAKGTDTHTAWSKTIRN